MTVFFSGWMAQKIVENEISGQEACGFTII